MFCKLGPRANFLNIYLRCKVFSSGHFNHVLGLSKNMGLTRKTQLSCAYGIFKILLLNSLNKDYKNIMKTAASDHNTLLKVCFGNADCNIINNLAKLL